MPELPEVEVICRALREGGRGGKAIVGGRIRDARVLWDRTVEEPTPDEFIRRIQDQEIQHVGRRAKYILIHLSRDYLVIHLRMSGDIRVEQECDLHGTMNALGKHDRVVISLDCNLRLVFEDARKFGRVWLLSSIEAFTAKLGPEPLDDHITPSKFYALLQGRHRQLKPLLMDQSFIAGMGNIYTDEVLHLVRLHPLMKSDHVSRDQAKALLEVIRKTLLQAIDQNGTSIDWVYRGGDYQNNFRVYQRTGEPCFNCGHFIERIVVGQRGTHYCPVCQTL